MTGVTIHKKFDDNSDRLEFNKYYFMRSKESGEVRVGMLTCYSTSIADNIFIFIDKKGLTWSSRDSIIQNYRILGEVEHIDFY